MVQITNYLQVNTPTRNNAPILNSIFVQTHGGLSELGEKPSFRNFIRQARKSPQLMAFLDILISDVTSDDIRFTPVEESAFGRNKKKKAQEFWNNTKGVEVLQETLRDMLLLGIGYNWMGKLGSDRVKEICATVAKNMYETKEDIEFKAEQIYDQVIQDAPSSFVKKLRHVAASTMNIEHNATEVTRYIQRVGVSLKSYSPEEIIVYKLMPFNGEVYPYCPMEGLMAEIYLLWLITQNYVSFFENGGHPDKAFILPKEIANSKNHQYLIETLQKYKKIQNKHGNLVFTGDLKVEDLMKVESQMDHQDLGLYIVGVLALFYKIPSGRIPFLIGKSSNNGDAGGLADAGYWRQISVLQSSIENNLNTQLFNKYFGVNINFGRGYKQDEVRETQVQMQKVQIAEQLINLGLWTVDYAALQLDIPEEVVAEAKIEKEARAQQELQSGMLMQNLKNNKDVQFEPDKQLKNSKKQETQNNNQTNAGGKKVNP